MRLSLLRRRKLPVHGRYPADSRDERVDQGNECGQIEAGGIEFGVRFRRDLPHDRSAVVCGFELKSLGQKSLSFCGCESVSRFQLIV
jgi:hypothetical protein